MKKTLSLLCLTFLFNIAFSQRDSVVVKPFQFTFFYPLSTAGIHSVDKGYLVSFNALAGVTGAARGIEIGGISNVNRYDNNGVQLAGISNTNGASNTGLQMAGICNITASFSKGAQFGGICNITGGSVKGGQVAGISNLAGGDMRGIQAAGISNVAGKYSKGIQLGGIGNVANDIKGLQVGGIFNVADNVKGVQLAGIINICDSIDGVPIALISIVGKNGYRALDVWTSAAFPVNLTYKIGIRPFYTMFSLGYRPGNEDNNMGVGFGVGTSRPFMKRSSLELEAHMYHINRYLWMNEDNFMYTLRLNYARYFGKNLALFAGPSLNMLHARTNSDAVAIAPRWAKEDTSPNYDWRYWLGFNAGIRF